MADGILELALDTHEDLLVVLDGLLGDTVDSFEFSSKVLPSGKIQSVIGLFTAMAEIVFILFRHSVRPSIIASPPPSNCPHTAILRLLVALLESVRNLRCDATQSNASSTLYIGNGNLADTLPRQSTHTTVAFAEAASVVAMRSSEKTDPLRVIPERK